MIARTPHPSEQILVWKPQPRQARLLSCPAKEIFFGGAKGGGKTDGALGFCIAHANRYGKKARMIFFRRSANELEDAIDRSKELFEPLGALYLTSKRLWVFPNGATLRMRHLDRDADAGKYQGQSYTLVVMDELGNYATPFCYNSMLSCIRSAKEGVHTQLLATGNPGGPGHSWIKKRFITGKKQDLIYTYDIEVPLPGEGETKTQTVRYSRCFIPSKVTDNHILMKNDPTYYANLKMLPENLQRAFLHGDWNVFIGQIFGEIDPLRHYIKPRVIGPDWERFATMDWGTAKPYSVGFWAVSPHGRLIRVGEKYGCVPGIADMGVRKSALVVATEVKPILAAMGIEKVYADPHIWQDQGHGVNIADLWKQAGVTLIPGRGSRDESREIIHTMLQQDLEDGEPMLQIVEDACPDWVRTIPDLCGTLNNLEDVDTNAEDHIYDDTRYAVTSPEVRRGSRKWSGQREPHRKYIKQERDLAV